MTEQEYSEFVEALGTCADGYLIALQPKNVKAYWEQLKIYDISAVKAALTIAPRFHSTFMPKPGELIALIEGSTSDTASVAWRTLTEVARAHGSWPSVQINDGALAYAVETFGGWLPFVEKYLDCSPEMEASYEKRFTANYRIGLVRGNEGQYFVGHHEANNRGIAVWKSETIQMKVVLVTTTGYKEFEAPFQFSSGQLLPEAREALRLGGEKLQKYLPAPPPQIVALLSPAPDAEMATQEEIAELKALIKVKTPVSNRG